LDSVEVQDGLTQIEGRDELVQIKSRNESIQIKDRDGLVLTGIQESALVKIQLSQSRP